MKKFLRWYFLFLVVGTTVVMLLPGLVIAGLFFGIIPGILLALCPTALLYSTLWILLRSLLWGPLHAFGCNTKIWWVRIPLGVTAAAIVAAAVILIPMKLNEPTIQAASAIRANDQIPVGPIILPDSVELIFHVRYIDNNYSLCGTICLRLLYSRAVKSILVYNLDTGSRQNPTQKQLFRVEHRERCPDPSLAPRASVVFMDDFEHRKLECDAIPGPLRCDYTLSDAHKRARARIDAGECLIQEHADTFRPELTISLQEVKRGQKAYSNPWSFELDTVWAERLEIFNPEGEILFRQTEVTSEPLMIPLIIQASGGFVYSVERRGLYRPEKIEGKLGPSARDVLPRWFGEAIRLPDLPNSMR